MYSILIDYGEIQIQEHCYITSSYWSVYG